MTLSSSFLTAVACGAMILAADASPYPPGNYYYKTPPPPPAPALANPYPEAAIQTPPAIVPAASLSYGSSTAYKPKTTAMPASYPVTSTSTEVVTVTGGCTPDAGSESYLPIVQKRQLNTPNLDAPSHPLASLGDLLNGLLGGRTSIPGSVPNLHDILETLDVKNKVVDGNSDSNNQVVHGSGSPLNPVFGGQESNNPTPGSEGSENPVTGAPGGDIDVIPGGDDNSNYSPPNSYQPIFSNPSNIIYTTVTETSTIDGGACSTDNPIATPTYPPGPPSGPSDPAQRCGEGFVYEVLEFDDFFDGSKVNTAVVTPEDPFEYKGFSFSKGFSLLLCENTDDERQQACVPETVDGDYYVALDSPVSTTDNTALWRRISFDIDSESITPFQILGFSASVFSDLAVLVTCFWTVADAHNALPSYCKGQEISGPDNILQNIDLDGGEDLAFIEIAALKSDEESGFAVEQEPVEFTLDNIAVCIPSDW